MKNKLELNILDKSGKKIDSMELKKELWAQPVNKDLLHRTVVISLSNRRAGTASTKTRKDVRGGGAKPWRQKGTGRARVGTIRSPLWKGGGVVFGPHPRDFSSSMPKKMKHKALINALTSKLNENEIKILDEVKIEEAKTKEVVKLLKKLKVAGEKILLVTKEQDEILRKASGNIPVLQVVTAKELTTYDVLNSRKVILTKDAFAEVEKRVKL